MTWVDKPTKTKYTVEDAAWTVPTPTLTANTGGTPGLQGKTVVFQGWSLTDAGAPSNIVIDPAKLATEGRLGDLTLYAKFNYYCVDVNTYDVSSGITYWNGGQLLYDVYANNVLQYKNVIDFYGWFAAGTKVEIRNIRPASGYNVTYIGPSTLSKVIPNWSWPPRLDFRPN